MKVSVMMITYNHEKYIAQAIDSVLMQETGFSFELVLGEDCSTDGTRDIVVEYARRHPDKIRLLLSETNLGGHENARRTRQACPGEYVAILEGDDYWTSPHKLQKQVDFLDSHPGCAMCFHDVLVLYEDGSQEPRNYCRADQKAISTLEDFVPNCSTLFRNDLNRELPDWYYTLPMGDWSRHILLAQHGDIGYIDEVMGVYRVHRGGVASMRKRTELFLGDIALYKCIDAHLNHRYRNLIRRGIAFRYSWIAGEYMRDGNRRNAALHLLRCAMASPVKPVVPYPVLLRTSVKLAFPKLWSYVAQCKRKLQNRISMLGDGQVGDERSQ